MAELAPQLAARGVARRAAAEARELAAARRRVAHEACARYDVDILEAFGRPTAPTPAPDEGVEGASMVPAP